MTRFQSVTAGAVVATLLAGSAAFAQGPRAGGPGRGPRGVGGPGPGSGGPGLPLAELKLTEAQQQQVHDIRMQERERSKELRERLRAAGAAERAAVETVPVNEGLVRTASMALADVQVEAAIQRAHVHSQIWAVLTPAQQAQATTLSAEQTQARQRRAAARRDQR